MNTKLTLRMDDQLIEQAKAYALQEGKSVSQIVSDYFAAIKGRSRAEQRAELHPRSSKLLGALKGSELGEEDYRAHLEEKYL